MMCSEMFVALKKTFVVKCLSIERQIYRETCLTVERNVFREVFVNEKKRCVVKCL